MGNFIKDMFYLKLKKRIINSLSKRLKEKEKLLIKESLASCGKNVSLRLPLVIEGANNVVIKDNVSFSSYIHIWGSGGVEIGQNTMIASHVSINSVDHDYYNPVMHKTVIKKKTTIGENVWIGAHSTILPGVKIGDGAVIGAHTLVKEGVPSNSVFVGIPGRVIKKRKINEEKY